jgi:mitotic spindle assembly checkpoint protein MAD2
LNTFCQTPDEPLKKYLSQVLTQISHWLLEGNVRKLVVVITGSDSGEVLERWVFNIKADKEVKDKEGRYE